MNERLIRAVLSATVLCLSTGGCVPLLGDMQPREVDMSVPDSFGLEEDDGSAAADVVEKFFDDANLIALIDEALANNQELNILDMEILIANTEILARKGEYLPKVGVGAGVGIEKVGEYTSQGASDASDEIKPGKRVPEHLPDFGLGFVATWEVDIWGKLHDATRSAAYRYLSSIEGRKFVVTRLVAEIARSYFELMALDNELQVLRTNIGILEDALEIVRVQKQAATAGVTELAVQRFEAEVLRSRSRQYDIQQAIVQTENDINLLVGRFPQAITRSSDTFLELQPKVVQTGLPGALLENRPDIRQAELDLAASKLDVEVARKNFFPSLSIEAGLGVNSYEASSLFELPESLFYGAFAGLTGPLINRRGLTADYYSANARQMQAVLEFEKRVRQAYSETASQLARVGNLGQKYEVKAQQVAVLNQAIEVSGQLFNSARADYMEVLLTRRDALEAQMELIETRQLQLDAMVNTYQAIGGGWRRRVEEAGSDPEPDGGAE